MRPFVFLDRDGTLIVEKHYLSDPNEVELIDGSAAALRRLREAGFGLVVVTNQAGVGHGYFADDRVQAVHERLGQLLAAEDVLLDAIYLCPHAPAADCECRKPRAGLIEHALRDHEVDLKSSFIIGDKESDIDCGNNAGVTPILVKTGYGESLARNIGLRAAHVARSLVEAADWILGTRRDERDMTDEIRSYFDTSALVLRQTAETCADAITRAGEILIESFRGGGKLLLCGNGGSAADCQHMATEFVSRFSPALDRPPIPALALTTDTSFLTAYTNDCGYEGVFARQIRAHGHRGDVLLAISTSGNSLNILAGARMARELGLGVIGLTGSAGALASLCDVAISVPSADTQHIQEAHLAIEHLLCAVVERSLFGR